MDYASMCFAVTHISGNISLSSGRFIGDSFMKDVILIVLKRAEYIKTAKMQYPSREIWNSNRSSR